MAEATDKTVIADEKEATKVSNEWSPVLGTRPTRRSVLTRRSSSDAQLFGRLADKVLLLDVPGAGTPEMKDCCHGGCDNCPYSRIFDEMRAGKAKWVAFYGYREHIDGRNHQSPWSETLFAGKEALTKEEFCSSLQALPYQACLGPMKSVPVDEPPRDETVEAFWDILQEGADDGSSLTVESMAQGMMRLTGEEHGAMWRPWWKALKGA